MLFLLLAFRALIIFDASAYGILASVSIPATERTAKINAAGIAWVGEKQDLTMPASRQAFFQLGLFLENASNNPIILGYNTANFFVAVPVRNELKTRLDLYYKKAKCSLISLMYLGIPSLSFFYFAIKKYNGGSFFVKQKSILNKSQRRDITE
jgi:hypothetical protein